MLNTRAETYRQILNPSEEYLQTTVGDVLSQIELPVDFAIDYAVNDKSIELDIDLPEIEDYPQVTSSILQSGKLSIKKKSVAELNKDYATSVVGMSFFFAGILFNISPAIEKISIAGYTQRLSKKTGNIEDQYVYSVTYTRDAFSKINAANIDPLEAIENFEHIMNINSKYELKTIDVKQSDNRKASPDKQELQTEYYRIEAEKKETKPQLVVAQLDGSSSSVIQQQDNIYKQRSENERMQQEINEKSKKIGIGCLIMFIIIVVIITYVCVAV